jgi:DNA-binding NarL/FixJ family response regulator
MPFRLLIVEDHPFMRYVYERMLRVAPELTLSGLVPSGEEALVLLRAGPCDVIVTDLNLPGMDGTEFIAHVIASWPTVPILVVSAHEETAYLERARQAGATACLSKRTIGETLIPTLRAHLGVPREP